MLRRREVTYDWMSHQVYRMVPMSPDLQRIAELVPEETIMQTVCPDYDGDLGRSSEEPVVLTKILFLSFYEDVQGDERTLTTLTYRMDWRQCCDLPLDAALPDRTTLVKFRRQVGLEVIEGMFQVFLEALVKRGLVDLQPRFFEGMPAKACARINPYRDEVYEETLAALEEKLGPFHTHQIDWDPRLNSTPVRLTKTSYAADHAAVETRWEQPLKPVAERESAGDAEARFQRGKHGKRSELGDDVFFSTDGKQLFIEDVIVSAEASQGQPVFMGKLEQSPTAQQGSVDAEFAVGEVLKKAEEQGVTLNTPPRQATTHGGFPKTDFVYEASTDTYQGPQGHTFALRGTNHKNGERHYRSVLGTCAACPLREQCPPAKTGRTVTRNAYEAQWEQQREHARPPQAIIGKGLRGIIAEGKFAEAVRPGLHPLRSVGQQMAVMQRNLIALILNFKRLLRVEAQGIIT
jgi:hypothetical protein